MGIMKRRPILPTAVAAACVALGALAALLPAAASAQAVELGQTTTPLLAPSCVKGDSLANCKIVLTRTTGIEASSDGVINPTRVNREGWIVSFTVGLSRLVASPSKRAAIIKNLDGLYGGAPELALSVLKPGPDNTYTVVSESGTYPLLPYLGQLLEQPLSIPPSFTTFTALHVIRGEVIGLTVPTWAPVLSYDLSTSDFSYRQSRKANCNNPASAQTAQTKPGETATYGCDYTGTRMQYSATEIVDPKASSGSAASSLRIR
jgi:hypothetical protein